MEYTLYKEKIILNNVAIKVIKNGIKIKHVIFVLFFCCYIPKTEKSIKKSIS